MLKTINFLLFDWHNHKTNMIDKQQTASDKLASYFQLRLMFFNLFPIVTPHPTPLLSFIPKRFLLHFC